MVYEWLVDQIQNNQFFSGALGGSVFYSLISYGRGLANRMYAPIRNLRIREISISSYDSSELYNNLNDYFMERVKNPQNLTVNKINKSVNDEDINDDEVYGELTSGTVLKQAYKPRLSYGTHYYWHNWYTLVYVNVSIEDHHGESKSNLIRATVYSVRAKSIRDQIINDFSSRCANKDNVKKEYTIRYGHQYYEKAVSSRKLDSVFINSDVKSKILQSISNIESKKKLYSKVGINRVLSIMLYGKPRTGKTTLIKSLAHELDKSIYYLDLSATRSELADNIYGCKKIPPNSILVIEDMDTHPVFRKREEKNKESKSLAGILKLLDGDSLPDNTIVFATTNYIDDIDDAVKQFGRFDLKVEVGEANRELAAQMINFLDSTKLHLLDEFNYPVSQAEIQAKVLKT